MPQAGQKREKSESTKFQPIHLLFVKNWGHLWLNWPNLKHLLCAGLTLLPPKSKWQLAKLKGNYSSACHRQIEALLARRLNWAYLISHHPLLRMTVIGWSDIISWKTLNSDITVWMGNKFLCISDLGWDTVKFNLIIISFITNKTYQFKAL